MSEAPPDLPRRARVAVFLYLVVALPWALGNFFVWLMGPCPAFSSNAVCTWSAARNLWFFPLSQVALWAGGYLLLRFARKSVSR